jgi:hypothetical protein
VAESSEPEWASLDVIRAELDQEREVQVKRGDAADSRAGVVLGFSGALAALAVNTKTLFAFPGALSAVVTAYLATRVLWPRVQNTVDPVALLRLYAVLPEEETKKALLKRRAADYEFNKDWIAAKTSRLKTAVSFLAASIALVVAGVSIDLIIKA